MISKRQIKINKRKKRQLTKYELEQKIKWLNGMKYFNRNVVDRKEVVRDIKYYSYLLRNEKYE